jgi:hypothetical protein
VLFTTKVNDTVQTFVSTTPTPTGNDTAIVAAFVAMLELN